jgi:hypothetical protein
MNPEKSKKWRKLRETPVRRKSRKPVGLQLAACSGEIVIVLSRKAEALRQSPAVRKLIVKPSHNRSCFSQILRMAPATHSIRRLVMATTRDRLAKYAPLSLGFSKSVMKLFQAGEVKWVQVK